MAIHEEQRNYKCDSCGKSLTQSQNLKRHIKIIHEWKRNYICDSCEKSFTVLGLIHINIVHVGQKDHKCEFCEKSFGTASNLKAHIKRIHT